jgi:phosphoglycolate phosphatase-like HAD superfamily hydrolase
MITNNLQLIVFDLDGTLVSSHKTIYRATLRTLDELEIPYNIDESEFIGMIGLHFKDIFDKFGVVVNDIEYFIDVFKSFYFDYIDFSELYPNAFEVLKYTKEKGYKVSLLTTKGQDQADKIVDHFGLREYFDYVMGRRPGINHKPSPEPLEKICSDLNIDLDHSLLIGDAEIDVQCGKAAGAKTCAITHGYRSRETLQNEAPNFLIDNLSELQSIIK